MEEGSILDRGGHPTIRDLMRQITFRPSDGNIRLNVERLVLQRASTLADMADELRRRYGDEDARIFMLRMGFAAGEADAAFIRKSWPNLDAGDAFTAGTRLHTMQGMVKVETVYNDFDFSKGRFAGEFLWRDGVEAVEHRRRHPRSDRPVCFMQLGYASGYATRFFGRLVVFKEVQCLAMGHDHCRVVGKPAEVWGSDDPDVGLFRERVAGSPDRASDRPFASARPMDSNALIVRLYRDRLERAFELGLPLLVTGPPGSGHRALVAQFRRLAEASTGEPAVILDAADTTATMLRDLAAPVKAKGGRSVLAIENVEHLPKDAQSALARLLEGENDASRLGPAIVTSVLKPFEIRARLEAPLFYRLALMPIELADYSSRREEAPDIAASMIAEAEARFRVRSRRVDVPSITARARDFDELRWLAEHCVLNGEAPGFERFPVATPAAGDPSQDFARNAVAGGGLDIKRLNRDLYRSALETAKGNVAEAARLLGLTRAQLAYRLSNAARE